MNDNSFVIRALLSDIVLRGSSSRSRISRHYGIRPATLTAVVERLKRRGLLLEPERQGRHCGRRASPLSLNPQAGSFYGLELTPKCVYALSINASGEEKGRLCLPLRPGASSKTICGLLLKALQGLRGSSSPQCLLGFADPGTIDLKSGRSKQAVNLPAWENVPLREFFKINAGDDKPLLAPETLIRTYAEYLHCAPDFPETLFHAHFDEGIGAGFLSKGELLIGERCASMELGHLVLTPGGRRCRCGNRGCLEAMAGAAAIRQMMQELVASGVATQMNMQEFSLAEFVRQANANDRAAEVLAQETCERIAPVMAMITTLLNPHTIIISGELAGLGKMLLESIRRAIRQRCLNSRQEEIIIKISALDEYAGARTAALLRRNVFLEDSLGLRSETVPSLAAGLG